jgi:transcription antitermination factor NusG
MPDDPRPGARVKIIDGTFTGMEGEVINRIASAVAGKVYVELAIFARTTPIELEPWQVEVVRSTQS